MDRSERSGVVRYDVRRKGLAALLLLGAVPWTLAGALMLHPAYFIGSSLFLGAAMLAILPIRSLFIDRKAGTVLVQTRAWGLQVRRESVPLSAVKRQGGDLLIGPLRLRATEKLSSDLST